MKIKHHTREIDGIWYLLGFQGFTEEEINDSPDKWFKDYGIVLGGMHTVVNLFEKSDNGTISVKFSK